MTQFQKNELQKLAKGSWQRSILNRLLTGSSITNPIASLQGKARNYSLNYQNSFYSLLTRLKDSGIEISRTPGPRGGEWSAKYQII